jgi:hypothetical protein
LRFRLGNPGDDACMADVLSVLSVVAFVGAMFGLIRLLERA